VSAPFRIAVLASGRGTNLRALIQARDDGRLPVDFAGVFSDRPGCAALALARERGIPAQALPPAEYADRRLHDAALFSLIEAVQPDLIVCAGYMRLISDEAVRRWPGKMINIHPSLLPRYPGLRTHARALAAGDREHGASVHCVIPELDAGRVLSQARLAVLPGDDAESLARRVLDREHPLLVQTVRAIALGDLDISAMPPLWRGVPLASPLQLSDDDGSLETGK
jgi:phosphoribosylglycinamide formyltransferase-1